MPQNIEEMVEEMTGQFRLIIEKTFKIGEASLCDELLTFLDGEGMDKKSKAILVVFLRGKSKEFLNQ